MGYPVREWTDEELKVINEYCENEMRKLKKICYPKIRRVCGDSNMDDDDVYSIAMEVLIDSIKRYDDLQGKFESFLSNNIQNKINTYIRDTKYRAKRSNVHKDERGRVVYVPNISIDASTSEELDLVEKIDSGFQIEEELSEEFRPNNKWEKYLSRLSKKQRKIATYLSEGYKAYEIRENLHITEKEYSEHMSVIKAYENISIIF